MAITIKGKTYRNIQEQVKKNMEDIEELKNSGEVGVIECSKAYEINSQYITEEELELLINKFNIIKYAGSNYIRTGISIYQNRYILSYERDIHFQQIRDSDTNLNYRELYVEKAEIRFDLEEQKYKFSLSNYKIGDYFEINAVKWLANLYYHNIYLICPGDGGENSSIRAVIRVIDNNNTPFTLETLHDYIKEATADYTEYPTMYSPYYPCNGVDTSDEQVFWGVSASVYNEQKILTFYKGDETSVEMRNIEELEFFDKVTSVARIRN